MTSTTPRATRHRRGIALTLAALAPMLLSGCTLITELQAVGQGTNESSQEVIGPDVPAASRPYYEQELDWSSCGGGLECATATAPMDWSDPAKGDIELALVKMPATGTRLGSLFTNPGGPGASGVDFVESGGSTFFDKPLRQHFDIIGWDPRGVGRSSAVECLDDADMDEWLYGAPDAQADTGASDEEVIAAATAEAQWFADQCAANTGDLLGYVDTMSTVNDLDMLRANVGDAKLNYFGFSYGTDIGAHYIDTYPANVGRVALDGATDPTLPMFDVILQQQAGFADAVRAYLADCLTGPACPFTGSVDDALGQLNDQLVKADETRPTNVDGRVLTSGVYGTAISSAMYADWLWPQLTEAISMYTTRMDPSGLFAFADSYNDRGADGHYTSNSMEAFTAINCLDYPVETDPAKIVEFNEKLAEVTVLGTPGPKTLGDVQCEVWPYRSASTLEPVVGAGAAPVLVIGTTGDPATPIQWAEAVTEQLESAVLIRFEGEGHTAYRQGDVCVNDAVDDYFVDGTVPEGGLDC